MRDVKSQNNHVDADVRVKMSEMTNGQNKTMNGVKWRYFQKVVVRKAVMLVKEGSDSDGISVVCAEMDDAKELNADDEKMEWMNFIMVIAVFVRVPALCPQSPKREIIYQTLLIMNLEGCG